MNFFLGGNVIRRRRQGLQKQFKCQEFWVTLSPCALSSPHSLNRAGGGLGAL